MYFAVLLGAGWSEWWCVGCRYWQLRLDKVGVAGATKEAWDRGVYEASEEYKGRMVGQHLLVV